MNKWLIRSSVALGTLMIGLVGYAFLNGASCHYSVDLQVEDEQREVFLTCYRGKVVALQSKQNSAGELLSQWRVEARHLRLGSQSLFVIYSRLPVVEDKLADTNQRYNQISAGYRLRFYRMVREGNELYVFQAFPRYYIHHGKLKGYLDVWDKSTQ